MIQGGAGGLGRGGVRAIKHAQAVQRPQGVDRRHVQADRIDVPILDQLDQRRHDVCLAAFHQQSLGVSSPEAI